MIDISLNINQLILVIVILVYIVIISITISKFHNCLDELKMNDAKSKLSLLTPDMLLIHTRLIEGEIMKLKKRSSLIIMSIGFLHILLCYFLATNILFALIPFILFLFVLFGNYWLKGSQVAGFIKTRPGQSDYHG